MSNPDGLVMVLHSSALCSMSLLSVAGQRA
jgi:hypothetical protein